jgi:hypothetical protein
VHPVFFAVHPFTPTHSRQGERISVSSEAEDTGCHIRENFGNFVDNAIGYR